MKFKQKKIMKTTLSEKIADALTLKPRADIEDDQVFGTKPQTVSRADFSTSESEDETAISDFRKRNVHLLSDVSKKYEGRVVSRKELNEESGESSIESDSENEQNGLSKDSHDHSTQESSSEQSDASDTVSKLRSLMTKDDSEDSDDLKRKKQAKPKNNKKKPPSESEDDESDAESDDYSITQFKKQLVDDESDKEGSDDDEDDNEEDDDEDDQAGYDISQMDEPMKEEFEHVKKQNISEEAKKGACVRNQLLVWEGLLEMRIHLQRCMNTANQMPMPEAYENLKENKEFIEECNTTKENVTNILDKFLTLQNELFKKFPETKSLSSKQKNKQVPDTKEKDKKAESDEEIPSDTDNEEIPSDTEPEDSVEEEKEISPTKTIVKTVAKKRKLDDYEKEIASSHKAFKSFRDSTIQKWNDKTRLATAANVKNTPTNTILQQISYILSDRDKLLRRTQLKRSEYDIVGYKKPVVEENGNENGTVVRDRKENDEYIPEIFDDSDFYHQLLRELIECKSADITDPVQLSRQWIALQQMRSKMKRKVDTKATKGRKIKYVVHNKLVNFMAPEKCTTWTDESTNELYSSLFGKMFEQNNVGLSENLGNVFKIK